MSLKVELKQMAKTNFDCKMPLKNLISFTKSTAWLGETQTGHFCQKRGLF